MKKRAEEHIETPIMSMIDVVFLLIIFFVVTSAIEKEAVDETIKLAKSYHVPPPTGKDPRQVTVNVRRNDDDTYTYSIAGTDDLSVVIFDPTGVKVPASHKRRIGDLEVLCDSDRGFRSVFFEKHGVGYALSTGTLDEDQLLELAAELGR